MRWEQLFDDLAGQMEHELVNKAQQQQLEKELAMQSSTSLLDRLRSLVSTRASATVVLGDGSSFRIRNLSVGRDWLAGNLSNESNGAFLIVPIGALAVVQVDTPEQQLLDNPLNEKFSIASRVGLNFVLRDLLSRAAPVLCHSAGLNYQGKITKLGRDHFDLQLAEGGQIALIAVQNLNKIIIL